MVTVTGTWNEVEPNWSGPGAHPVPVVLTGLVGLVVEFTTISEPAPPRLNPWNATLSTHAAPLAMSHCLVLSAAETRTQSKPIEPKLSRAVPARPTPDAFSALPEALPTATANPADGVLSQ